ncbi:hypothetical protein [Cohnella yongneupensis]|uniref:Polymer-forming cytoskeletal protein n=1 Tax=Cohnella yongneupensis TaxID=425006 RepID=A0ABW0QZW6_9BACL
MIKSGLPDLVVNGVSTAAGGTYGNVKIDGVGKVSGDIDAKTIKANGVIRMNGAVKAEEMDCDGKLTVGGNLAVGRIRLDGLVSVKGIMSGEHLDLHGLINVKGDCEIEKFDGEGVFEVDGLLSVGTLNIKLQGRAKAREIGVESMVIRQVPRSVWSKLWSWMSTKFVPELQATTIEGDDIDLEYTKAQVVRGNRVVIGKGCVIDRVEYKTELKVNPGATIKERVKTGG